MNAEEFREHGKAMVDYIADYFENLRDRQVLPSVEPGYLRPLIPEEAPEKPQPWRDIMKDVDNIIEPGITHWNSPNFHAYFPSGGSFPAILGEMLSAGFGCVGFSWMGSPACTELEAIVMNWLGKLLGLPEKFLNSSSGTGGGIIQGSVSESTLVALLAAKDRAVKKIRDEDPFITEAEIKGKLIAYTSDQANSSVEKAGVLGSVPMKHLQSNENGGLIASVLAKQIRKDREAGLIPCYVVTTLGTTGLCSFDDLEKIGPLCNQENLWLHVDAAYAGAAFICPEYRHLMKGIEYVDSFTFSPHKWMLVNFECTAMWVKNSRYLVDAFNVERIYLPPQNEGLTPDYRHWQIALGRRFKALKLWFVLRSYGAEGIRNYIRTHVSLAKYFEELVLIDYRFEVCTSSMGLVCFRLLGDNELTEMLLELLMARKNIYVIPYYCGKKFVIRFVVCSRNTEKNDIDYAWNEIVSQTEVVLNRHINGNNKIAKYSL